MSIAARIPSCVVVAVLFLATVEATRGDDDPLRTRVYAEYPLLDPNHPQHEGVSDWDTVCMLREFSYCHTSYTNHVASESYQAGAAAVDQMLEGQKSLAEVYEFFDQARGGVVCGHTAHLLQRLYTEFGYKAWYVGHGFSPPTPNGSNFTHAETLVRISVEAPAGRREILTLHDPSVNLSYTDADRQTPLDYFEILRRLKSRQADSIAYRGAIQGRITFRHPATVCHADETAGKQPSDFVASWNVDENYQWFDLGQGRWRFDSPRRRVNFERLGDQWWKKELVQEGMPGETIYLHAFPFHVSGAPNADAILDRAAAIVGPRSRIDQEQERLASARAGCLPGEWLAFRRDPSLLGHSPGIGHIVQPPRIAWRHFVGRSQWRLLVEPADTNSLLTLHDAAPRRPVDLKSLFLDWFPAASRSGFATSGQHSQKNQTTIFADILPEVPGQEKIVFSSGFDTPTRDGRWQYGPGQLLAREDGTWRTVWQTRALDHCFQPRPLVGDFDRDGELEVAVLPWRELMIYDARTGKLEQQCKFTEGRSYGLFGVYDFDQDGTSEFLVMADYSKHVDVLGYREGQVTLLWQYEIELDFDHPEKLLGVPAEPVADLNGDGRSEVFFNLFNDRGEGKWRLVVRDGMTGELRCGLADEVAECAVDLDGDGACELLTTAVLGQHLPSAGPIRVRRVASTAPLWNLASQWQGEEMAWQRLQLPDVNHQQNLTYTGRVGPMICPATTKAESMVVMRKRNEGSPAAEGNDRAMHVVMAKWADGGFQELFELSGTSPAVSLEPRALRSDGALLVHALTDPDQNEKLIIRQGQGHIVDKSLTQSPSLAPPSIAWSHGEPRPTVVAQGFGSQIVALTPPAAGSPATELWRLDGRSPSTSWPEVFQPVVGNLFGDGRRQLIYADEGPGGVARLTVADLASAATLWQHAFPRFAGRPPKWNRSGLLLWQAGHFTDVDRHDLLVTLRRSIMHSDETVLLSGIDGRRIWQRDRQIAGRGCGGQPYAIADLNGDGLDDAASMYTHLRYILDGSTGDDLLAEENDWPQVPLNHVYWMQPVAGPFDSSGRSSLLCTTTRRQMIGRIRADGDLVWSDAYDHAANGFPAIGDFDADGRLEAIFVGFADGTRCYDTNSGTLEWKLNVAAGQDIRSAVSADLDGDGRDEAVFTVNRTLYCVGVGGDGKSGEVAWTVELPTQIGDPVIAEVPCEQSGEGQIERGKCLSILVSGRDGHIYCVY